MELQEFIQETLVGIAKGVTAANEELRPDNPEKKSQYALASGTISSAHGRIEFDVALTVQAAGQTSGGGKVQIAVLRIGLDGQTSEMTQSVSRVKFTIHNMLARH